MCAFVLFIVLVTKKWNKSKCFYSFAEVLCSYLLNYMKCLNDWNYLSISNFNASYWFNFIQFKLLYFLSMALICFNFLIASKALSLNTSRRLQRWFFLMDLTYLCLACWPILDLIKIQAWEIIKPLWLGPIRTWSDL